MHRSPSSHAVPSAFTGLVHCPVAESHTPASWQSSTGVQTMGAPVTQLPDAHVSPTLQRSPSSHDAPSTLAGFEHCPVPGSHAPVSWHWSRAVHTTASRPAHTPATHVSVAVQRLLSSHVVASGFTGDTRADDDDLTIRVLHRDIIAGVFELDEAKVKAGAIQYPKSALRTAKDLREGHGAVALYTNPLTAEDVFSVTSAGEVLPQKSTFFFPKLPTGLVFRPFEDPD